MTTETGIEYDEDYQPPKEPHTWVDWLMLAASFVMACVAAYFTFGA